MSNYASILESFGYKVEDRGTFFQTSARYRGGDNKTALCIYKDSGICYDFVTGKSFPFEVLVKAATGKEDVSDYLKNITFSKRIERALLSEEKTFPESSLKKLLPDYEYFSSRGLTAKTQKNYKCGLATGGKLYQRIVFPIYRFDGKIHGFIGRKVIQENDRPKWLNYGKSADWFYPFYSIEKSREKTISEGRVYVVESIGDSMKMFQNGFENNLVGFSNKVSPRFLSTLANLGVDVVFAFNNDEEGINRGKTGALISILKASDVIDMSKIWFVQPNRSDFGEMNEEDFDSWRESLKFDEEYHLTWREDMLNFSKTAKIPKNLEPKLKRLK